MLLHEPAHLPDAPDFMTGGGRTGALMRVHDWSASPLGASHAWPQSLKTLVGVILSSSQPMFVAWGAERTLLYNDAYTEILAAKHPAALGKPFLDVWDEIRADLVPIVDRAFAGEPVHMDDILLVMERKGYPEETHFAFSYTPVRGDGGGIAGMFCACVETTAQALGERRRAFLIELEHRLRELSDPLSITAAAQEALGRHLKASRVGYGEVDDTERYFTTARNWTDGSVPPREGTHDLAGFGPEIWAALRHGERLVVRDVRTDPRTNSPEGLAAFAAIDASAAVTASLVKDRKMRAALYVHHREPQHWTNDDAALVEEVAERTWAAVERARAEQRLRIERDRSRGVLEGMSEGFMMLDRAFRVLDINAEGLRLDGRPRDAIVGRTHWELWPGTSESELGRRYRQAMRDRKPVALEHRYVWPDGRETWLDMRAYPAPDGLALLYRDVTARRAAEARNAFMLALTDRLRADSTKDALDAAVELMGRHFGCTRVGYGYLNTADDLFDYDVCWTDGTVPPLLGRYPAHAFGVKIVAKLSRGEPVVIDDLFTDPLSDEQVTLQTAESVDTRAILVIPFLRDGRLRSIVYLNDRPVRRWTDEDVTLVQEVAERTRQIIARAEAEEALRQLNANLEAQVAERTADRDRMWRLSTDLMLVARFDSTITAINPAWTALLGWREDELIGRHFLDLVHPDDAAATAAEAGRLADGRTTLRFENRYRARDGSYRWLSWTAVPDERFIHAVARDITAEKAAAAELEQVQEALRQSQKMEAIGQLTGGVAHDFNNLLTVIRSSADLLRRDELPEAKRRRYIDAISETADRAAKLTSQLLAFARRQALKPEVFEVSTRAQAVTDMLRSVVGSRIAIRTELDCEHCHVEADPTQFETALVNMAVNARDAMDGEGTLTIAVESRTHVSGRPDATAGDYVAVSISDTGCGIDPDHLTRIFEPFFTTKEVGKGTGLGLSQVYGFAQQSGGEVSVASERGKGTTFTLFLPQVEPPAIAEAPADLPAERPLGQGHILVVEDNEQVGAFSTQLLAELGFETSWAANADAALALLERNANRYAAVFSDVVMPGMNGVELGREIRRRWPALPVVLTSGYSHVLADDSRHGFELLQKPYSADALMRILRRAIGGSGEAKARQD